VPEHIGSLAFCKGGGAVVALGDRFYTLARAPVAQIENLRYSWSLR
jgi:hypothetical protein